MAVRLWSRRSPLAVRGRRDSSRHMTTVIENRAYVGERYGVKKAHAPLVSPQLWKRANERLRECARTPKA